jgi:hypothetical protein
MLNGSAVNRVAINAAVAALTQKGFAAFASTADAALAPNRISPISGTWDSELGVLVAVANRTMHAAPLFWTNTAVLVPYGYAIRAANGSWESAADSLLPGAIFSQVPAPLSRSYLILSGERNFRIGGS